MVDVFQHQRIEILNRSQTNGIRRLCLLLIGLAMLIMSNELLTNGACASERARPFRIGVLTDSWGPTPETAGLRDGLLELGYHERKDFVIGVRFTQGNITALPKAYRSAAHRLGIVLVEKSLQTEMEAKTTLAEIEPGTVDGILAPRCCALNIPGFILEAAAQKRLPTMFEQAFWVEQGALSSYGPDYYSSGKQAARLVAKIMKGEKPANIAVETNSKIEFAINRQVAKIIGLTIAPEILYQAHRLIR